MKKKTARLPIFVLVLLLAVVLPGCGAFASGTSSAASGSGTDGATAVAAAAEDFTQHFVAYQYGEDDFEAAWAASVASATSIVLDGSRVQIDGGGAVSANGIVTIEQPGTYVVSGETADGEIIVYADKTAVVCLVLDGVSVTNSSGPAIHAMQAGKTVLLLAEGSKNSLCDAADYQDTDENDEPDAAIFSKDDLTITGSGTLHVEARYLDGIVSKDVLAVTGGNIAVNAVDDGLRGTDGLAVCGGVIEARAGGDGVKSTKDEDTKKGFVVVDGGTIRVTDCYEGIEAPRIQINGGDVYVDAQDDGINAAANVASTTEAGAGERAAGQAMPGGMPGARDWSGEAPPDGETAPDGQTPADGQTAPDWSGRTPPDDQDWSGRTPPGGGTAPDGQTPIDGQTPAGGQAAPGETEGLSAPDGDAPADAQTAPNGQTMPAPTGGGRPGMESFESGDWPAATGGMPGGNGQDVFSSDGYVFLRVTGGVLDVKGGNDGIDANGNVYFDGGEIKVNGLSMGMEGAIDLDGSFTVTGGSLITAGSVLSVSEETTQAVLLFTYSGQHPAGSVIELQDAAGTTLLAYEARMPFSMSAFSSESMADGETYSVWLDGEKLADATLSGLTTSVSEDGSAGGASGIGGGAGFGGVGGGFGRDRSRGEEDAA